MQLVPRQDIVGGKYTLSSVLGSGAFGEVWLAHDNFGHSEVAIKLSRSDVGAAAERFQREIQISNIPSLTNHPHLLTARTQEREGDARLLVLPYMAGGALRELLSRHGRLPPATVAAVGAQLADALGALHTHPQLLVHRDVHPGNIFFSAPPGDPAEADQWASLVRLGDFGLVYSAAADAYRVYGQTDAPNPGHAGYRAPEAALPDPLTPAADVYSLGVVLWEMLVARPYREARGRAPRALRPDAPAWLSDLVMRCLDDAPANRPANGRVLAGLLAGPGQARPVNAGDTAGVGESVLDFVVQQPYLLAAGAPPARALRELWSLCDREPATAEQHFARGRFKQWLQTIHGQLEQQALFALADQLEPLLTLAEPPHERGQSATALEELLRALGAPVPTLTIEPAALTVTLATLAEVDSGVAAGFRLAHGGARGLLAYAITPQAAWVQVDGPAGTLRPGQNRDIRLRAGLPKEAAENGRWTARLAAGGGSAALTVTLEADTKALARELDGRLEGGQIEEAERYLSRLRAALPGDAALRDVQERLDAIKRRRAAERAAEQKRRQAEAQAAEEKRRQAEAQAAEQKRRQAEAQAAEQKRRQAEAQAAEEKRRQAEAQAAKRRRVRWAALLTALTVVAAIIISSNAVAQSRAEQATAVAEQPPATPIVQARSLPNNVTVEMVFVPAGPFTMGSNDGLSDERPVHTVTLDAFWIDRTEVTNAQYAACVAAGACDAPSDSRNYSGSEYYGNRVYDNYSVIYVRWNDAVDYCAWRGARLPTEAEWEKAARGTDARVYPWGDAFDGRRLNYCDTNCPLSPKDTGIDDGYRDTAPAGSYPDGASPYGALDMAGNVWEWVADWYSRDYYAQSPTENPGGPANGKSRVLRGGAWYGSNVRASYRNSTSPSYTNNDIGFRCAQE